ncbi:phospholipase D-like domain-containing protein [Kosmotoga sp. DU53]|uniref:phospholipase D-like domain-containing protein n=1 Tax=Kosmotoga sp. DU53 TaxID=1310160 RepID=UPI0007C4D09A|nr:phospholipase D-like domain-containing protein [Kosmotoga sp. DU53]
MKRQLFLFIFILFLVSITNATWRVVSTENSDVPYELVKLIDTAESTVLLVAYSLDLDRIIESLNDAVERGVFVEAIVDDSSVTRTLSKKPKFKLLTDSSSALIHAKFLLVDNSFLVFGTGNFSRSGLINDSNVFVITDNEEIVQAFTEIYSAVISGNNYFDVFQSIEIYLTPAPESKKRVIEELTNAKDEILFLSYAFTDPEILSVLKLKSAQGIEVKGVIDSWNKNSSPVFKWVTTGMRVRVNPNEWRVHDKIIIIDRKTAIFGSANLTLSAWERNREIIVIIELKEIVDRLINHFNYIWEVCSNDS